MIVFTKDCARQLFGPQLNFHPLPPPSGAVPSMARIGSGTDTFKDMSPPNSLYHHMLPTPGLKWGFDKE